jgi:3-oxocholest-4-en-26-oyl-CoA dehydrogenase beta subunit
MDLAFSDTQEAIRALCKDLFSKTVTPQSLQELEASGRWLHQGAWDGLVQSELLGLAISEEDGGAGLGLVELCIVLQQIGRHAAPVPYLSSIVTGALPLCEYGTAAQKAAILPSVLAGRTFLSAALVDADSNDSCRPATTAEARSHGWLLRGNKSCVPDIDLATHIIIPARVGAGIGVFLVKKDALDVQTQVSTHGEPLGFLCLDGVPVDETNLLGSLEEGAEVLKWIVQRAMLAQCAIKLGIAESSLFMTAKYTSERKQFGVPVATFQAVSQRAGDAYIDLAAMKVSLWRAAWQLGEGIEADKALSIAMYWAAEAGHNISFSAQHLHAGMGFDRDYPLHRYFLWSKHYEFTLGGANMHLDDLGKIIARQTRANVP